MTQEAAKQFSPELRERAVRTVQEREREGGTQWEPVGAIAAKVGCSRETLGRWVRRGQRDTGQRDTGERDTGQRDMGQRPGLTTDGRERIRALQREVRELRQANGILREARACLAQAELDRPFKR